MTAIAGRAASLRTVVVDRSSTALAALGKSLPERIGQTVGGMAHRSVHDAVAGWLAKCPVVGGNAAVEYAVTGALGLGTSRAGVALSNASARVSDPKLQRLLDSVGQAIKGGGEGVFAGELHDATRELSRRFPGA